MKDFLNKKIIVKQVRSSSKLVARQKGCVIGLGLRGIGSSSELLCTESVAGMLRKVAHIIEVKAA